MKPHTPTFKRLGLSHNWQNIYQPICKSERQNILYCHTIDKVIDSLGPSILHHVIQIKALIVKISIITQSKAFESKAGLIANRIREKIDLKPSVSITVVRTPLHYPKYVALSCSKQIHGKMNYRSVITKILDKVISSGALGCKIRISGRLRGAEMSTSELFGKGLCPLNTLNYNISYHFEHIKMPYGKLGLKVYINNGYKDIKSIKELQ